MAMRFLRWLSLALALCGSAHAASYIAPPQGRLTLQTGKPVMTADQAGVGTIYYDAYNAGNIVPYYTGSADASDTITAGEMTLTLETSGTGVENNNDNFDIWWWHNSGTPTLCAATNGSGGGWSSDTGGSLTARGTGYSQLDTSTRQYITNKNALSHCYNATTDYGSITANQATYLGSFYTTAAGKTTMNFEPTATSGGTNNVLGLYNPFNQVQIGSIGADSNSGWTYNSTTWRALDSNNNNRITWLDGQGQMRVAVSVTTLCTANSAGPAPYFGISFDSTTAAPSTNSIQGAQFVNGYTEIAGGDVKIAIGLHYGQAMEKAGSATTYNCAGVSNSAQVTALAAFLLD